MCSIRRYQHRRRKNHAGDPATRARRTPGSASTPKWRGRSCAPAPGELAAGAEPGGEVACSGAWARTRLTVPARPSRSPPCHRPQVGIPRQCAPSHGGSPLLWGVAQFDPQGPGLAGLHKRLDRRWHAHAKQTGVNVVRWMVVAVQPAGLAGQPHQRPPAHVEHGGGVAFVLQPPLGAGARIYLLARDPPRPWPAIRPATGCSSGQRRPKAYALAL